MKPTKSGNKTAAPKPRSIFLVEDHPMTRRGLKDLIGHETDLVICGEADNASRALELIQAAKPDLALIDITLPKTSGLMLIKDIRKAVPGTYLLALSMHDESLYAERVLRVGGHGYIMKNEGGEKLLQAIRLVLDGKIYVSENVSRKIVDVFVGRRGNEDPGQLGRLTAREFEVFQLLGQGLASVEIGRRLSLSSKTVDTHRLNIKQKLQFQTLPQLMRYAVRWAASEERL